MTLAGCLANYEAAYQAGEIADYYQFPGSRMRMLDEAGRRWARRLGDGVKPLSRDGARIAFQELERIAGVPHVRGRGWYGLRRVATDIAEIATTDDRVKDRLGGWHDSETRKQIYQDREAAELRIKAADVRRQIRLGSLLILADGAPPAPSASVPAGATTPDLDALVAALTPEQRATLAAKLNAPRPVPAAPRAASAADHAAPGAP
jgi:hypothetical protein